MKLTATHALQRQSRASILGDVLTFGLPAIFALFFLVFGIAFLINMGDKEEPEPEATTAAVPAAAPAPSAPKADKPATEAPAKTAEVAQNTPDAPAAPAKDAPPAEKTAAAETGAPKPKGEPKAKAAPKASTVSAEEKAELMKIGKSTYMMCAACHAPNGQGMPGNLAPNLVGSPLVLGNEEALISILLNGITPSGQYNGAMIGWKMQFDDKQLAGVMTYIRNEFGNTAPAIAVDTVAKHREKLKDNATTFARADLEKMAAKK